MNTTHYDTSSSEYCGLSIAALNLETRYVNFNGASSSTTDDETSRTYCDNMLNRLNDSETSEDHIVTADDVVVNSLPIVLRKPTKVRVQAATTIAEWWRIIVPCVTRLRMCRKYSTRISNTWRMYVALFKAKKQLQHVKRIQAVLRRHKAHKGYQQQKSAVLRLQRWHRASTLDSKLRALLRHIQDLRRQHQQRVSVLQESLESNTRELESNARELDEMQDSYLCLITHSPLREPVFNRVDARLYEKDGIEQWVRTRRISPLTHRPMNLNDLLTCQQLQDALNRPQHIHCDMCSRLFRRSDYQSTNQMVRAYTQHIESSHTR